MGRQDIVAQRVLMPDGIVRPACIRLDGPIIDSVDGAGGAAIQWDAGERLVLPGIVDLHGDAFERQIMPRPGVSFDVGLALLDTDRQMLANGITTAYHAITYSWEPGLRGRGTIVALLEALDRTVMRLGCDTRMHLRFETYNLDAVDEAIDWIDRGRIDLLAFNDHTPPMLAKMHDPNYLMRFTQRTGLSPDALKSLLERVAERAGDVPSEMARMALRARTARIPLASHDDEDLTMRAAFRELGCAISEFPKTEDVANDAVRNGEHVIFGAPNVVRGGSHLDGIAAAGMVERGLCTVLASDYYYPALLQGALRLVREGILDLARAWALVSGNPAAAGGLNDRGAIAPGQRADFIVVDDRSCEMPGVVATFVAGRSVYVDGSLERRAA